MFYNVYDISFCVRGRYSYSFLKILHCVTVIILLNKASAAHQQGITRKQKDKNKKEQQG